MVIPEGVTHINHNAFSSRENLQSVVIPSTVLFIGGYAFQGTSLTEVQLPDGLLDLKYFAFADTQLREIDIPAGVGMMEASPFASCSQLTEIRVSPDNQVLTAMDGVLFSKDMARLVCYPAGKPAAVYTIPEGVREICNGAFYGSSITGISIPNSVTRIGSWAFHLCRELTSLVIPNSVDNVGTQPFQGNDSLESVTVGEKVFLIDFDTCPALKTITVRGMETRVSFWLETFDPTSLTIYAPDGSEASRFAEEYGVKWLPLPKE